MFHRLVLPVLLICLGWGSAGAQQTQPTTAPVADLATPKGTLRALVVAMETGDVSGIKNLFQTTGEMEERMAQAMADVAVAYRNLRKVATDTYGEEGAESFLGPPPVALSMEAIEKAQVTEEQDAAVVRVAEPGAQPMHMVRSAEGWKVSMEDQARRLSPEVFEQQVELVNAQVGVMNELAEEIAAGKYPTPAQAGEALRTRSMQAAFGAAQGQNEGK